MADDSPQFPRALWLGLGLVLGFLALAYLLSVVEFNQSRHKPLPILGPVSNFTLTNQDGKITTLADFSNHVWVADIIFTRCAGPCPEMTRKMSLLEYALPKDNGAKLVTLTTDPDYDSPTVIKKYGERFGADFNRWVFLTGTKSEIGALAANSLKLSAVPVKVEDQKNAADLFIHTTIFVVVDKHARLRGSFETVSDGVDWTNAVRPRITAVVRQLEREP
jgi:protein SCO1/2